MTKAIALAVLMTVLPLLVLRQTTGNRSSTDKDKRTEEEVRRLNDEELEALLHNDSKTLARIFSDDFVVTNPFNRFLDKKQVLGLVESGALSFSALDRRIQYLHVYGDTVIVAGSETGVWAGTMPFAGQTSHLRITSVWMLQGGRWQEVARHANIIPEK